VKIHTMKIALYGLASLLCGCAGMVATDDGRTLVIEHDAFISADRARGVAVLACQQRGAGDARYVSSANKQPRLPKGSGVQLSAYECVDARPAS